MISYIYIAPLLLNMKIFEQSRFVNYESKDLKRKAYLIAS